MMNAPAAKFDSNPLQAMPMAMPAAIAAKLVVSTPK
jgi:thiamine pyrophosphate-dependent acetolactate synthase large subunit-like protein